MPHEQTGVNLDTAIDTLLCFVHDLTVTGTRKHLKYDLTADNKKHFKNRFFMKKRCNTLLEKKT